MWKCKRPPGLSRRLKSARGTGSPARPTPVGRFTGFTLLEVLVVIGLVGIVGMSTLPVVRLAQSQAQRWAAYRIAAQMEETKLRAMASQKFATWKNPLLPAPLTLSPQKSATFSETGFPQPGSSGTWTISSPMGKPKKVVISSAGRVRVE